MPALELNDNIYRLFADFIYQKSGIDLGANKKGLLKTRLQKRISALGLSSFEEYYELVVEQKDSEELVGMLDVVSTNYTFFFRERDHFDFLLNEGIGCIAERKNETGIKQLRAWCAASSTGEEAYSIMICLLEKINPSLGWDIKMLATDISTQVLEKAKRGVYGENQVQKMPKAFVHKYLDTVTNKDNNQAYRVKPILNNYITYRRLNLMNQRFPFKGKFDFIFCRNVMIYFDRPTQEMLIKKMASYLEDDGYLFIGHSEALPVSCKKYLKTLGSALFQKIKGVDL